MGALSLLLFPLLSGVGGVELPPQARWSIVVVLAVLTAANLLYGLTVKGIYHWIESTLRAKFVKRQARTLGVDLGEFGDD